MEGGWAQAQGFHIHLNGSLFVVEGCTAPVEEVRASSLCDSPSPLPLPCRRALPQGRVPELVYGLHRHRLPLGPESVCATVMPL